MSQYPDFTLRKHQAAEVAVLMRTDRALLLSGTGTGKTVTLLHYARSILEGGGVVAWVTKTGLVQQLLGEAQRWLTPEMQPVRLGKSVPSSGFIVATHGQVTSRIDSLGWLAPDLVIIDEANALAGGGVNPNAATYTAHLKLTRRARRSVLATATPVGSQHGLDLLALHEVGQIPGRPSREALEPYLIRRETPNGFGGTREYVAGIRTAGIRLLTAPLRKYAVRTTLDEIGEELPLVRRDVVAVPLTASDRASYAAAQHLDGLRGHRLRQAASRSSSALVEATVDVLEAGVGSYGHSKIVVFSDYFDLVDPTIEALVSEGESVIRLDGAMTPKQRHDAIEQHRTPGRHILVGTSALETGLNLQHASLLVTVVASWSKAREVQREGRLVRLGSRHREVVHVTIRPDVTLEARKTEVLDAKWDIAERVLSSVPSALQLAARRRIA